MPSNTIDTIPLISTDDNLHDALYAALGFFQFIDGEVAVDEQFVRFYAIVLAQIAIFGALSLQVPRILLFPWTLFENLWTESKPVGTLNLVWLRYPRAIMVFWHNLKQRRSISLENILQTH